MPKVKKLVFLSRTSGNYSDCLAPQANFEPFRALFPIFRTTSKISGGQGSLVKDFLIKKKLGTTCILLNALAIRITQFIVVWNFRILIRDDPTSFPSSN